MFFLGTLDRKQLAGLSDLCFDLAKASFLVAVIPASSKSFIETFIALFVGLAFTYMALLFLKVRRSLK